MFVLDIDVWNVWILKLFIVWEGCVKNVYVNVVIKNVLVWVV